jgi:hypothetical protein
MNYKDLLKRWRSPRGFGGRRPNPRQDNVQGAISLACLRGWWRTGLGREQQGTAEKNPVRPLTPWSHGLF